jgi:hypothetical protein
MGGKREGGTSAKVKERGEEEKEEGRGPKRQA